MFRLICTAVFLLSLCTLGRAGLGCPIPDACVNATCSRFLNADCIPTSECEAQFIWRGRDVTARCGVEGCDQRECPANRMCVEQVIPPTCPEERPRCRQYLRARCNMIPPDFPESCDEIMCGEGMECFFRDRGEGFRPVVRCVEAVIDSCDEITCPEGMVCELRNNRRPVCVPLPPPTPPPVLLGLSCEDLSCPPMFECCLRSIPSTGIELQLAVCLPSSEVDSLELTFGGDPPTCASTTCPVGQNCFDTTTADDRHIHAGCFNNTRPICESDADCAAGFECVTPENPDQPSLCFDETLFIMLTNESCLESERECPEGLLCRNSYLGDALVTTSCGPVLPFDRFSDSCDQVLCTGVDEGCIMNVYPERLSQFSLAYCMGNITREIQEFSMIIASLSITGQFGLTCEELNCLDGTGCQVTRVPSAGGLQLAQCSANDLIELLQMSFDLFVNRPMCNAVTCEEGQICVELKAGETFAHPICLRSNCFTDEDCGMGEKCFPDTPDFIEEVDTLCVPEGNSSTIGRDTCEALQRDCGDLQCQEVCFEGDIIGTACNFPVTIGISCDELDCVGADVGCIEVSVMDINFATCTPNFASVIAGIQTALATLSV